MKTKKIVIFISLIVALMSLTACKEKLTSEKAGILFVNRLIYEDKDERFVKNFLDGEKLAIDLKAQRTKLTKDLVSSFNEFGGVLSESQTEEFMNIWFDKLLAETYYEVKSTREDRKEKNQIVYFDVYGLDFEQVYKNAMDQLVEKMLADTNLAKNNVKLGDLMMKLLTESIAEAKVIESPMVVKVTLKQTKKKWTLIETKREEEISNILLAFLVGVDNLETYSAVIGDALTKSMDEALDKVEAEYGKKEPAKDKATETKEKPATQSSSENTIESTTDSQMTVTVETMETYQDDEK